MEFIKYEKKDNIAVVTLDRAPVNAFNYDMYMELAEAFKKVESDKEVRAVVITGNGKFYSAGNDVADFADDDTDVAGSYYDAVNAGLGGVWECTKPIVAAVNGTSVGAGFCTVSASDVVVSVENAKFGVPEVKVGVIGGGPEASYSVPRNMVKYMYITGDTLPASDLYRVGVIHKICEPDELLDTAMKIAKRIASNPPLAVKYVKQSIKQIYGFDRLMEELLPFTDEKTAYHSKHPDFKEASRAFLEKREPRFVGGDEE